MPFFFFGVKLKDVVRENFFLIGPLGFEDSLEAEIREIQPWILGGDGRPTSERIEVIRVRKGGLELRAPRLEGCQLVHHVKGAVRLLWRWKSKKISHVSELKTYLRGLRPQDFFEGPIRLEIQSRKSRLQNEKMLLRVFKEDWPQTSDQAEQVLYVDVYDDQFTLSWDLCGEPLFKRGRTPFKGQAPLRENLASLLLRELVSGYTAPELRDFTLLDPMMGSGTFLWEALGAREPVVARKFAYQDLKGIPSLLKTEWWKNLPPRSQMGLFSTVWGLDQDPKVLEIAQNNSRSFEGRDIVLQVQDVLRPPSKKPAGPTLMISNPPYGERLEVQSIFKLLESALDSYQPHKALFVWPEGPIPSVPNYRADRTRQFLQGGIPVQAVVFSRIS